MTKKFIDDYIINKQNNVTKLRVKKYCPEGTTVEDLYLIYNDMTEAPACRNPNCNKKAKYKNFSVGYYIYCSRSCAAVCPIRIAKEKETSLKNGSKQITVMKSKITLMKKYGVDNALKLPGVGEKRLDAIKNNTKWKEKRAKTNLQKFGHVSYAGSDDYQKNKEKILKKTKATCLEKYGVPYSAQSEYVKSKAISTNLEKYGVPFYSQTEESKDRKKSTNLEKYGVPFYSQTDECKDKSKVTCLKKYGVEFASQSAEFRNKVKSTCLEKYGVPFYSQTEEFRNKVKSTRILNGTQIRDEDLSDIERYRQEVLKITNNTDISILLNYEKRGSAYLDKGAYHLDHIISVKEGFLRGFSPQYIGSIDNLQMLHYTDNTSKQDKCWSLLENKKENKWEPYRK